MSYGEKSAVNSSHLLSAMQNEGEIWSSIFLALRLREHDNDVHTDEGQD